MSDLWLPDSARPAPKKVYVCHLCGTRFPERQTQQWQRHVLACDRRNGEQVDKAVAAAESSVFTSIADKEQYAFLRKQAVKKKLKGIRGVAA